MKIDPVEIPKKITSQSIGYVFEITPVAHPELELSSQYQVQRFPFRSNAYYYTKDMWIDNSTVLFETVINPNCKGTVMDPNYSMVWKGTFMEKHMTVQVLIPPEEKANTLLAQLDSSKSKFYYVTNAGIFCLDLKNLNRQPILLFKDAGINQICMSLSLSCDNEHLFFATWKTQVNESPNGRIYMLNLVTKMLDIIDTFTTPDLKVHLDASPIDPNLLHYCLIKETEYPRSAETNPRLWLMDLPSLRSKVLYIHQRRGILRKPEILTHETWGRDGTFMTVVVRRNWIKKIHVPSGRGEIIMDGSKGGQNPWHCDGKNGKLFVFDTMNKDTGMWIGEFGSSKLIHLSKTRANSINQVTHPHPLFSPKLDRVLFNSVVENTGYLHFITTNF